MRRARKCTRQRLANPGQVGEGTCQGNRTLFGVGTNRSAEAVDNPSGGREGRQFNILARHGVTAQTFRCDCPGVRV